MLANACVDENNFLLIKYFHKAFKKRKGKRASAITLFEVQHLKVYAGYEKFQ